MDDGCDLVTTIYTKHNALLKEMIGGCEETTTGVIRLHAMEDVYKRQVLRVVRSARADIVDRYGRWGRCGGDYLVIRTAGPGVVRNGTAVEREKEGKEHEHRDIHPSEAGEQKIGTIVPVCLQYSRSKEA